jgi:serine/threonine-protein kinase RsbW
MDALHREYQLFGLKQHEITINKIIEELEAFKIEFDIKLILTEGLSNAYKHGNNSSEALPIFLRYDYDGKEIVFEIEDSGAGSDFIILPNVISYEKILEDNGRGLYLIGCFSDAVHMVKNKLIIKKFFCKDLDTEELYYEV